MVSSVCHGCRRHRAESWQVELMAKTFRRSCAKVRGTMVKSVPFDVILSNLLFEYRCIPQRSQRLKTTVPLFRPIGNGWFGVPPAACNLNGAVSGLIAGMWGIIWSFEEYSSNEPRQTVTELHDFQDHLRTPCPNSRPVSLLLRTRR